MQILKKNTVLKYPLLHLIYSSEDNLLDDDVSKNCW